MRLTKNFTLDELCVTSTGLPNRPDAQQTEKLLYLAWYILQPVRDRFGAIRITSGYRSPEVNRAIGGSMSSQHVLGEAADIQVPGADLREVYVWMRDNLRYGQLIYESRDGKEWIHVSLPRVGKKNMMVGMFDGLQYLWTSEGV